MTIMTIIQKHGISVNTYALCVCYNSFNINNITFLE